MTGDSNDEAEGLTRKISEEELVALDMYLESEVNSIASACCNEKQRHFTSRFISGLVKAFIHFADNMMYFAGLIFVPVAWFLISGVVVAWYKIFAPMTFELVSKEYFYLHAIFAHWLLVNIVFNYFMVTVTSPGEPPKILASEMSMYIRKKEMKYCNKCQNVKPLRTHHCSVCNRCVLKMDHHCPWTHNCIGLKNQRYFFLFMAYLWVGCVYVAFAMFDLFWLRVGMRYYRQSLSAEDMQRALKLQRAGYLSSLSSFSFLLTVAVGFALGVLLLWHIRLVSTNTTTIEFYAKFSPDRKKKMPIFVKRTLWRTWRRFLGIHHRYTIWGVLFPWKYHPADDGVTWDVMSTGDDDMEGNDDNVELVQFNNDHNNDIVKEVVDIISRNHIHL
eukprot:m.26256 g.26256  ORF g.26256 m.26256 type:complete len:388 (-) comp9253_c0_seq1:44-1207(-)